MLAELEGRAGPSDQDREAWLAARRKGVTATEVAYLYTGKKSAEDLVLEKLSGGSRDISGVPVVAWGIDREPAIITSLGGMVHESRVFQAADNPRFLASPDALGEDEDGLFTVEIKTSWRIPAKNSPDYRRWMAQLQWAMRVLDVNHGWLVIEERLGVPNAYRPGICYPEWIERDDALIEQLEQIATSFLQLLDEAEETQAVEADAPEPVLDGLSGLLAEHRSLKTLVAPILSELEGVEAEIRELVGARDFKAEIGGSRVAVTVKNAAERFDQAGFKAVHPEMYQRFMKLGAAPKPSLQITHKEL